MATDPVQMLNALQGSQPSQMGPISPLFSQSPQELNRIALANPPPNNNVTPQHIIDQLTEFDRGRNEPGGYRVLQIAPGVHTYHIYDDNNNLIRTIK